MTGSGPPQSEPLTILEDVVQQTLVSEQVEGGIDTTEPSVQDMYELRKISRMHIVLI